MKNNFSEKRKYGTVIAAVVSALVIIIAGLATGLTCAVQKRMAAEPSGSGMARYLLEEAAYSLKSSMSALRLCNESEPAENISRTALVHAVRAETALECDYGDFADSRNKEAFLNDISTVLHSYDPLDTVKLSDKLYEYSSKFYDSVVSGAEFEYNGELIESSGEGHPDIEITDDDIAASRELVEKALDCTAEYVGAWDGHIELHVERNGKTGYAVTCGSKIIEYSFMRSGGELGDEESAKQAALEAARACGYEKLEVAWCEPVGKSYAVIMCRNYDGAIACDDYASAVVVNGEAVSFAAGKCETEHTDIPKAKKTEREAAESAVGGGTGRLVVRKVKDRERICYEFRYELDDGVHYVYVCAENGKQMEVK